MKMTVSEICQLVEGELIGWGDGVLEGLASLDTAGPGDITFARRDKLKAAAHSKATAVFVPERVEGMEAAQIVVENPYFAFGSLLHILAEEQCDHPREIHPTAVVGKDVQLGKGVALGAHAVVGDHCVLGDGVAIYPNATIGSHCTIGDDTVIHANVAVREYVTIGRNSVIHSCCTIGGDGFGYLQIGGKHVKIPQVGTVEIGDDVEIGCNCTIDRATMDKTVIGNGVKVDNHSHVAHNVQIGDDSMLVAYARIGGSTVLGKGVLLAEDVGITNNVTLGDGCMVGASSKVSHSWPAGSAILGAPAQKGADEKRQIVLIKKLPRLYETLRKLKAIVEDKLNTKV